MEISFNPLTYLVVSVVCNNLLPVSLSKAILFGNLTCTVETNTVYMKSLSPEFVVIMGYLMS